MTVRPASRVAAINHILGTFADVPEAKTHLRLLKSVIEPVAASAKALEQMRANADPTITQAAHDRKIIASAAKLADRGKQANAALHRVLGVALTEIQSRIDAKVNLKADDKYASEIRATVRAMPMDQKLRTLAQFAAENKAQELAAVTEAPGVLSGVPEEHQKQYRNMILNTHAGAELAELAELNNKFFSARQAIEVADELASDLHNVERLAEINKGVEAASAFAAAFENATE